MTEHDREGGKTTSRHSAVRDAGAFLRGRFHQWMLRGHYLKANALTPGLPQILAKQAPGEAEPVATEKLKPGPAATHNAQNCTFEVF